MLYRHEVIIACASAVIAAATPAFAQAPAARPASNPDPVVSKAMEPAAATALRDAADALGMVRFDRTKAPPRISYDTVHTYEYVAAGTVGDLKVTRATVGIDFGLQSIRSDLEDAAGQRTVTVASGQLSRDESKPGVFLRAAATPAAERLKLIWLFPQGVIHAAAKAPDKVKVAMKGGNRELSVALADGTEVRALMDAENNITHVEMQQGGKAYTGDYSAYKQDIQEMDVMFPSRIVQKVDGKVVADLTVSEHYANPYVIFPPPKELAAK